MNNLLCKFFFGIIRAPDYPSGKAISLIREEFGPTDTHSPEYPFDMTDYYETEMGRGLIREFISLEAVSSPSSIVGMKTRAALIEQRLAGENGCRPVNIDPGYMDCFKIVLASYKEGGQKIYLGEGIWADMTMYYKKGRWLPFPWTFPDFRDGRYDDYLTSLREKYKTGRYV